MLQIARPDVTTVRSMTTTSLRVGLLDALPGRSTLAVDDALVSSSLAYLLVLLIGLTFITYYAVASSEKRM